MLLSAQLAKIHKRKVTCVSINHPFDFCFQFQQYVLQKNNKKGI